MSKLFHDARMRIGLFHFSLDFSRIVSVGTRVSFNNFEQHSLLNKKKEVQRSVKDDILYVYYLYFGIKNDYVNYHFLSMLFNAYNERNRVSET